MRPDETADCRSFQTYPRAADPPVSPSATPLATGARLCRSELRNAAFLGALVVFAFLLLDRADLLGGAGVLRDLPVCVTISAVVHMPQLLLTALAWRTLIRQPVAPSLLGMTHLRWVRESAGTLLPGGGVLGQVWAARQLARCGVPSELAGATATVDVTAELAAQLLFTLLGLGLLLGQRNRGGVITGMAVTGCVMVAGAAAGLVAIQRLPRHRRLAGLRRHLARSLPRAWRGGVADIHAAILCLHAERRRLATAVACHSLAWTLGAVEVAGVLYLLGRKLSPAEAIIIESMGQALRNAGFMLPGAAGIQEGAIVAAAALVGVPAGPALTASLVRRAREVLMALPGIVAWQRTESAVRKRISGPLVRR